MAASRSGGTPRGYCTPPPLFATPVPELALLAHIPARRYFSHAASPNAKAPSAPPPVPFQEPKGIQFLGLNHLPLPAGTSCWGTRCSAMETERDEEQEAEEARS